MPRTAPPIQGIYIIANEINGKVYIGQSVNILSRFDGHFSRSSEPKNKNNHLYQSMNKYGRENFTRCVLERVEDVKMLSEREQYWIDYYQAMNPTCGYNSIPSHNTNRPYKMPDLTPDAKRRRSDGSKKANSLRWSLAEEHSKMSKLMSDRMSNLSEEDRGKYRSARRTPVSREASSRSATMQMKDAKQIQVRRDAMVRYFSDDENRAAFLERMKKKRVRVIRVDVKTGEELERYDSITIAGRAIGVNPGIITGACKNYCRWTAGGFYWRYENDVSEFDPNGNPNISRGGGKPVNQIDVNTGAVLARFDTISSASISVGRNKSTLQTAIANPRHRTAAGYYWEYAS